MSEKRYSHYLIKQNLIKFVEQSTLQKSMVVRTYLVELVDVGRVLLAERLAKFHQVKVKFGHSIFEWLCVHISLCLPSSQSLMHNYVLPFWLSNLLSIFRGWVVLG